MSATLVPTPSGQTNAPPREKAADLATTPAQTSGLGATTGAEDLAATLARKQAKIDKLKSDLAIANAKPSTAELTETLARKQNKINLLKGQLETARTEASNKKVQAITAENKLGETQTEAAATQKNTLLVLGLVGAAGYFAWKKGWLK